MISRLLAGALVAAAFAIPASASEALRIATFNVEALDAATASYTAAVDVVKRLDADVVFLQEITTNAEVALVPGFASATGFPFHTVAAAQGTLTGALHNAVLSKHPIVNVKSWGAAQISTDPTANDITRDLLQVEIAVPETCLPIGCFTVHLKSGSTSTDKFRRAVEILRLKKVIENWATAHPGAPIFLGGDFNDDVFDAPFGNTFNGLPSGLPGSYDLGSDITFPVVYDPFTTIAGIGGLNLTYLDATSEDCTNCYATRPSSGRRLDYVFARPGTLVLGDEVYASPSDNGVDTAPLGNFLYKGFSPLPFATSTTASDHYTVFGDFLLNSCDGSRYGAGYPGDHSLIPRAGIKGTAKPGASTFGMRLVYGRPSTSAILVLGKFKLNPPFGISTSPYVPGATLYIDVTTAYGIFPTVTDAKGDSNFTLPLPNSPTILGTPFEAQWFVSDAAGPNGVGSMSDAYSVVVHA